MFTQTDIDIINETIKVLGIMSRNTVDDDLNAAIALLICGLFETNCKIHSNINNTQYGAFSDLQPPSKH